MKKKMQNIIKLGLVLMFLLSASGLNGQIDNGLRKWIRVGSLQSFFDAYGAERAWNANTSYYEGVQWPAWYADQDNFVIDRSWVTCRDFTDADGTFWDYKSVSFYSTSTEVQAMQNTLTGLFDSPLVSVDGTLKLADSYVDSLHDPNLPFDRILTDVSRTSLGVEVTRKVYAFSQQYHDNYFITTYTFKNTGNTDGDDEIELPNNVVTDFYYGCMPRYATSQEARLTTSGDISWGMHQWVHHTPMTDNPDIPCFYSWLGQVKALDGVVDNIGGPIYKNVTDYKDGRLSAPQFAGMAILHVPASPTNDMNDYGKLTMGWHGGDTYGIDKEIWDMLSGVDIYKNTGSYSIPMDEGKSTSDIPQDTEGNDGGGAAGLYGVGPYTLQMGESVTIVTVEAVSGLDREHCTTIGQKWLQDYRGTAQTFTLPDGSNSTDRNEYKDAWVYSGKDSIMQTFRRAKANYESGFALATPPPPPANIYIESLGDKIALTWSGEAESASNFGGYKIFRATAASDSIYHEIFSCGAADAVNSYEDKTPSRGISYYYYVCSLSDGSLNTDLSLNPAGQLMSGRAYTQTVEPAYLRRQSGMKLADIRIVANPYSIANRDWQYGEGDDMDRIYFLEVPGHCVIKIFTERGDLIKTIHHEAGSGDKAWNLDTDSRQVIVSGVYIAYFQVTQDIPDPYTGEVALKKGDATYKKFIVIR